MLTKLQAELIWKARDVPAPALSRGDRRVADTLGDRGLLEPAYSLTTDEGRPVPYWRPTLAGLEALVGYWRRQWGLRGCLAYLDHFNEAEAALERKRAPTEPLFLSSSSSAIAPPLARPIELDDVLAWIGAAPVDELRRAAEAMKAHVGNINRQLDEQANKGIGMQ